MEVHVLVVDCYVVKVFAKWEDADKYTDTIPDADEKAITIITRTVD